MLSLTFLGTAAARPTVERSVSSLVIKREGETLMFDVVLPLAGISVDFLGICLLGEAIGTRLLVAMALVLAALSLRDGGATDPLAMRDSTRA